MGNDKGKSLPPAVALRRSAEERLNLRGTAAGRPRREDETQRLLHELQVHQIELEMQNAELIQARDEVEKTLEKYTDLYDFAPVGYLTLGRDGTIKAANLTVASLLGVERPRLLGRRFEQMVTGADRPVFTAFLQKVCATRSKEACELALLHAGNGSRFVRIEAVAAASEGECRAAILDISERRRMEEHLDLLRTDLAARAAELETANIELEAFSYTVSHDLRKPLTAINSYVQVVQLMCGNGLDEKCRGYLQEIYEGTLRMSRLIDTLLNFSHFAHVEMCQEKVDLSKMAEGVAHELKVTEPARRVSFRIAPGIVGDGVPVLMRVVLDNLIGNAWKFAGSREETVIEFGGAKVDGKSAYFVRDNGPGFDPALADQLFHPFQRFSKADADGHGIGLATVKKIIERHGGRVLAECQPNEGATFYFTFD
jgi:PAS domain S-box-containing protein